MSAIDVLKGVLRFEHTFLFLASLFLPSPGRCLFYLALLPGFVTHLLPQSQLALE